MKGRFEQAAFTELWNKVFRTPDIPPELSA
jgi:hypothetical protein